ncbi:MAG: AMP-binding protein [Clostridium sp.]|jgi:phenylacetate-CoA ligase|nr:AMP-binding protein [Clostridium sp.]
MTNLIRTMISFVPRTLYYSNEYRKVLKLLNCGYTDELLDELLCRQLTNALKHVPFYRNNVKMNPLEINKDNAKSALKEFPVITKDVIMNNIDSFLCDNINIKHAQIHKRTSGGSTGQGITVYRTLKELMIEQAFYDYKWGPYGFGTSAKIVRIGVNGIKKEEEYPVTIKGHKMLLSPYHFNERWISTILKEIQSFKPKIFHAYPSSFEYLAHYMDLNKHQITDVKAVLLASEAVSPSLVKLINNVFPCVPVLFSYGLTERTNLAWGRLEGDEVVYDIEPLYGYTENIENEMGFHEIVGTSYWNLAMPFIRYQTEDIGEVNGMVIRGLDGRAHEFLVTKTGGTIPGFSVIIDKFVWQYVESFQIVQNEPGLIEIQIKPRENFTEEIKEHICEKQRERWGQYFDISIVLVEKVNKTRSGKQRLIINNIKKERTNI